MKHLGSLLLLSLLASPVAAQEANPLALQIGDQVRLQEPTAESGWVNGTVARVESDSFGYTRSGPDAVGYTSGLSSLVLTKPYSEIAVIEVNRKLRRHNAVWGAKWGSFLGFAAGAISGPFIAMGGALDAGPAIGVMGAAGGAGGALIGAALGALVNPGRWYRHVMQ